MADTAHRMADASGLTVFCREAGEPDASALALLHEFPSASPMLRELIPLLADGFHLPTLGLPGFGKSGMPRAVTSATPSSASPTSPTA